MSNNGNKLNVVVVGASAGGVEALKEFAAGLPADFPYAVLVVLHLHAGAPSVLARILERSASLPTAEAVDGEPLQPGTIRVAVPDRHLVVHDNRTVLTEDPAENGHRPAINALFRSVAQDFGRRAVSVLLSGVLDDGTQGSAAIRSQGGTTIAQSPADALFPAMPRNAIEAGLIDYQARAEEMGELLTQLSDRAFEERDMKPKNSIAMAFTGQRAPHG